MIRAGIYDDQEMIRVGLESILTSADDVAVVHQGGTGLDLVNAVRTGIELDLVLVDIRMPIMDGLSATRAVTGMAGAPAVIVLTTFNDDDYVLEALEAGASGFLLKRSTRCELLAAVRAVAAGDAMLSPEITRAVIERSLIRPGPSKACTSRVSQLTARELEVLRAVASGATNSEIARSLQLSESTVKTHVSNVLAKTGSRDRVQAVLLAIRAGVAQV